MFGNPFASRSVIQSPEPVFVNPAPKQSIAPILPKDPQRFKRKYKPAERLLKKLSKEKKEKPKLGRDKTKNDDELSPSELENIKSALVEVLHNQR